MGAAKKRRRTATGLLALLDNKEFQHDALEFYRAVADVYATTKEDDVPRVADRLATPFFTKWDVPPPPSPELVRPDPRRRKVDAIASGRWSVVTIFPWTTEQEIRATITQARGKLRRQHHDRAVQQRRVQQASWLSSCGIQGPEIAKAVWKRHGGLQRLPKSCVTSAMSYDAEERLLRKHLERGHSYHEAEQLVLKRARGSEAPATVAIRVASERYFKERTKLNVDLQAPRIVDARSHALTLLFRAVSEQATADELRQRVEAVQQAFVTP
jgi:hypothetical protein